MGAGRFPPLTFQGFPRERNAMFSAGRRIVLLALLLAGGCAGQRGLFFGSDMSFSEGSPVVIDGRMESGEWDDAFSTPLSRYGEVLMKRRGDHLYLGLQTVVFRPVYLAFLSDSTVTVGRAGAYLSTARFEREGARWRRAASYRTVQVASNDEQGLADHLQRMGWTASTQGVRGERWAELCVTLPPDGLRLALALGKSTLEKGSSPHWPVGLDDSLGNSDRLEEPLPEKLVFHVEKWPRILPEPAADPRD
jgi:hypothetical protein